MSLSEYQRVVNKVRAEEQCRARGIKGREQREVEEVFDMVG